MTELPRCIHCGQTIAQESETDYWIHTGTRRELCFTVVATPPKP